jgi:hypothetical protein
MITSVSFGSISFQVSIPQPSSIVPDIEFNSFSPEKITIEPGDNVLLEWNINKAKSIQLYSDEAQTVLVSDVTNSNSYQINNIQNDSTYYLDYGPNTVKADVFVWNLDNLSNCSTWLPDANTINNGQNFTQTRSCDYNYSSNEPDSKTERVATSRVTTGTKVTCNYSHSGSGTWYKTYTGVVRLPDGNYRFFVNGSRVYPTDTTASSVPGYSTGPFRMSSSGSNYYEICPN